MKYLIAMFLVFFAMPAYAQETGLPLLVTDPDPKGTNVRANPGGAVIRVIPFGGASDADIEMRRVTVTEVKGQWFWATLADNSNGWIHTSVVGTCASATEDGDPAMYTKADESSAPVARVKDGAKLRLLEWRGDWARVQTAEGAKKTGWMMTHTLLANPYNSCWK
ncbi:MAG: hypothetical protein LBV79_02650 [Candidatus Adiutrix sp.]|nr:hypothetical protein [Candidatus Adiutrix sp.]